MISDDEFLERVIAGIHTITTTNADVTWNEVINGRQFDVVVRFKLGSLRYLVLVEVKNRTRKTGTSDMEAFVQKAKDQNANKAVFVTAAGFQDGAIKIAKRHGVDLFTVSFDHADCSLPESPELISMRNGHASRLRKDALQVTIGEPHIINNIERIALIYADGTVWDVPSEQSQMAYCCAKTILSEERTLQDVLQVVAHARPDPDQSQSMRIPLEPHTPVVPPDRFFVPAGVVTAIDVTVAGRQARPPLRPNPDRSKLLLSARGLHQRADWGEQSVWLEPASAWRKACLSRALLLSLPSLALLLFRRHQGPARAMDSGRKLPERPAGRGHLDARRQVLVLLHSRNRQEDPEPLAGTVGRLSPTVGGNGAMSELDVFRCIYCGFEKRRERS